MSFTKTYDGAEPVRINKWLGQTGVCSRREADALIADGLVSIDGEVVRDAGRKLEPGQTLTLNDTATAQLAEGITVVIHKPTGYVSGQPEPDKLPAIRLISAGTQVGPGEVPGDISLPPIGRLDEDSRGLLMLSSDGVVAKAVIGPASELDKEYLVVVDGVITEGKLSRLRHGLVLNDKPLKPARVTQIEPQRLRFVLTEGKYRQIRRMCELVGLEVVDLYRTRIGPLELGDLPEGRWRHLTADERAMLIAHSAS